MCELSIENKEKNGKLPSNKEPTVSSFEDILELVGTNGWRNILLFIASGICSFIGPFHTLSYQFLGAIPDYWCDIPALVEANWTAEQIKNYSMPFNIADGSYDQCQIYRHNYTNAANIGYDQAIAEAPFDDVSSLACEKRAFDPAVTTITTDWDLVCNRLVWYSTTQSVIQGGVLIASLVFGFLLDSFGRRPVMLICTFLYICTGFLTILSNGIGLYIFFKTLASFLAMGFYLGGFVLSMELCTPSQRSVVGNFYPVPWALGYILTPVIAYFIRPWRWLQAALTVPSLLLIANYWILPESPRWLIINNRFEEAYEVFKDIADSNKREIPSKEIMHGYLVTLNTKLISKSEVKVSLWKRIVNILNSCLSFIRVPKLRILSLVVFFMWFSVSMSYYGVSLGSGNLEINEYLYILIGGVLELPSYLMLWPAMLLLGRKKTLIFFYILGGVLILTVMTLQLTITDVSDTLLTVLSLIGKVAFTAGFQLVYVVTAELYPTQLRSLAVGISSFWGRIGSMTSPYINDLLGAIDPWIPAAVFGAFSFVSGLIAVYLPETSNIILPESNEAEEKQKAKPAQINEAFETTESVYL